MKLKRKPGPFDRKRSTRQNKRAKDKLIKEARDRRGNYNIGGSNHVIIADE